MGALWCRDLPRVTIARAAVRKRVTVIVPYYENPRFLRRQLTHWALYPADLKAHLEVIVVDDGSPTAPAAGVALDVQPGFPLRLFRIDVDRRWNWLAARNIGAHHASEGWLLLTDMDHVVPDETLRAVVEGDHDPGVVYAFGRVEHTGQPLAPHSASFLMTRAMFWRIGGYDEALSGHYGTDGEYRRRVAATAPMHVLPEVLVRYEFVDDSSTTRYLRKQAEDAAVRRLVSARRPGWTPLVRSFPYHEVASCSAS